MRIVFRRAAKIDLAEARDWYEARRPSLSDALRREVDAVLRTVVEHPEMHPRVEERIRRAALHRFPYGIFYTVDGETIYVVATVFEVPADARLIPASRVQKALDEDGIA